MATIAFNDFNPISSKQWKQKIQFELNGADYNQTLVWTSPEDIQVRPFYHADENIKPTPITTKATQFSICQNIFVHDVEKSASRAIKSLTKGADSLRFTIANSSINVDLLFRNIPLSNTNIYFNLEFFSIPFIKKLDAIAQSQDANFFYNIDPIGQLAREGNWFKTPEKTNFDTITLLERENIKNPILSIDATLYQNAGANIVQQIAFSLAHANEYLNRNLSACKTIVFQTATGSNYFFEIAKIRALKLVFQTIKREYDSEINCHITATPSKRNKTLYDYNVNMLRTTTECMSAILGGADTVSNLTYDSLFHKDNSFGDRMARNQLLILKHEAHFDKVNNPADGSYYIESITQQLAEKSLQLFKEIEADGGFLKLLNDGTIRKKIQESATKEQNLFDNDTEILVGSSKFINKEDKMKENLELFPFVKIKPRKTLIVPIIEKRLTEKLEQTRLDLE